MAPECRRMAERRWPFWARAVGVLPVVGTVLIAAWIAWLCRIFDPCYLPSEIFVVSLVIAEGMAVLAAFLLAPATLAAPLGGENQQGALDVLLISRVSAWEILLARLCSRLLQACMILLAAVPWIVWLGFFAGLSIAQLAPVVLLPFAVAFGGAGMAVGVSTISRRARTALVAVYILQTVLVFGPFFAAACYSSPWLDWLLPLNPFPATNMLARCGTAGPIALSIGWWMLLGVCGLVFGAWCLRPSYLRSIDGSSRRNRRRRRKALKRLGDNPMLWKELHADRTATLGWLGRWLGRFFVALLILVSLLYAAAHFLRPNLYFAYQLCSDEFTSSLQSIFVAVVVSTGLLFPWLLQWAIGLRAAVSIAAERERATWDSILATPLESREIVTAKILGSAAALRYIILAVLIAWIMAAVCGETEPSVLVYHVLDVAAVGCFMAVAGVCVSLFTKTTAWAMTLTLAVWLGASIFVSLLCVFISLFVLLISAVLRSMILIAFAPSQPVDFSMPFSFEVVWHVSWYGVYAAAAVILFFYVVKRFDGMAGRDHLSN